MALEALEALDSGYDSSEWAVSWSQVCETPRGHGMHGFAPDTYEEQLRDLESRFGGTYANGVRKFALMYNDFMWRVVRLCPCGKMSCSVHVISPAVEGLELADEFSREDVMTVSEASAWWLEQSQTVIVTTAAVHSALRWVDYCVFPPGRELYGLVKLGEEDTVLRQHFGDYVITAGVLQQLCPCGTTTCTSCIFPGSVVIEASFPLVLRYHVRQEPTANVRQEPTANVRKKKAVETEDRVGDRFRLLRPMTAVSAKTWWNTVGLRCETTVSEGKITLLMVCRCNTAQAVVPCEKCAAVLVQACAKCGDSVRKRSLERGLCQDCVHKEVVLCRHCGLKTTRGHFCTQGLVDCHFSQRETMIYPPLRRHKGGKTGICLDCGTCQSYNGYHRHQYRKHSGVKPSPGLSRDYALHKCYYCNFSSFDKSQVTVHQKRHILMRTFPCRHACGKSFRQHSAELQHCRLVHGGLNVVPQCSSSHVQEGGYIVRKRKASEMNV